MDRAVDTLLNTVSVPEEHVQTINAVSLRVLLFIHLIFWKFGKRIIARQHVIYARQHIIYFTSTRDIFKKDRKDRVLG